MPYSAGFLEYTEIFLVASISGALAGAIARERQERQVPGADSVSCFTEAIGSIDCSRLSRPSRPMMKMVEQR